MPVVTREFSAEFLTEEIDVTYQHDGILLHEEWDTRRWYVVRRVVFAHDSQAWEIFYKQPATEMQEDLDAFDEDPVTATLVEPFEKTIVDYRHVER